MLANEWLRQWFSERSPDVQLSSDDNYYEKKAIDSFGIIELIEEVEDSFQIDFSDHDFQDHRFSTIGGLANMISEKMTDEQAPLHDERH
jgi:D-alanine--poly(phosphoribitol) ligase subunit 2